MAVATKSERTRAALAETALALAAARGVDGFTISDVTDALGMTRRTFANHFSCKEEAIAHVVRLAVDDTATTIPAHPSVSELIAGLIDGALRERHLAVYRAVAELSATHGSLQVWLDAAFRDVLDSATRQLLGREDLPLDSHDLQLLLSAIDGMADVAVRGPVEQESATVSRITTLLQRAFTN